MTDYPEKLGHIGFNTPDIEFLQRPLQAYQGFAPCAPVNYKFSDHRVIHREYTVPVPETEVAPHAVKSREVQFCYYSGGGEVAVFRIFSVYPALNSVVTVGYPVANCPEVLKFIIPSVIKLNLAFNQVYIKGLVSYGIFHLEPCIHFKKTGFARILIYKEFHCPCSAVSAVAGNLCKLFSC